jgi:predicted transcriptional regulator
MDVSVHVFTIAIVCGFVIIPNVNAEESASRPITYPPDRSTYLINDSIGFVSEINGSYLNYSVRWDFGDGSYSEQQSPNHRYYLPGEYVVVYTRSDDNGISFTDSITLSIRALKTPSLLIELNGEMPSEIHSNKRISFTAVNLYPGDVFSSPSIKHSWDFGDGITSDSSNPSHSFSHPGTFNITLTLSDGHSFRSNEIQIKVLTKTQTLSYKYDLIWFVISIITLVGMAVFFGSTEIGISLLLPIFVFLYTKIKRNLVLDNYTRGQIHGYIMANPGEHYNSIKGALELNNGTLAYHLNRLETEQIVKSRLDGLFRRYYPASMKMPEPNGHALTEVQRSIMSKIKETPGISQRDIASLMRLSNATINYHLERLLKKGTVRRERAGMRNRCFLTPEGELEMDGHHGAPPQNS